MDQSSVQKAATLLANARKTGQLLENLPADCRPATTPEAHAIQDATVAQLGDSVAGWKVMPPKPNEMVIRGVVLTSRLLPSPARIAAAKVPLLGIEQEIAFRFDKALPSRASDYTRKEVEDAVTAFVAIEIVDSRYRNYKDAPPIEKFADFCSNGGLVQGTINPDWKKQDLSKLEAVLTFDGEVVHKGVGGHPTVDPLLGAIALVNQMRKENGVQAGVVMTTGTYTGLKHAKPGQKVVATFTGFGSAEVQFLT
jgi:2-keto-4-pentenoate hydratase